MAVPLRNRRGRKDRRRPAKAEVPQERRGQDRRQFPPPNLSEDPSAAAMRLQAAIDEYKQAHRLVRVSLDELLGIMTRLGYREV